MTIDATLSNVNGWKNRMFKKLTLVLFFILPKRITNVFISLSLISLIFNVRNSSFVSDSIAVSRVGRMLRIHLDESVLLLPEQTCKWYWDDTLLDSRILNTPKGDFTVRELIQDNRMFIHNRHLVLNCLLNSLPRSLFMKLNLTEIGNRLTIKHNVASAFIYG